MIATLRGQALKVRLGSGGDHPTNDPNPAYTYHGVTNVMINRITAAMVVPIVGVFVVVIFMAMVVR